MFNQTNHNLPAAETVNREIAAVETSLVAEREAERVVDVVKAAPRRRNLNQSRA